MCVCDVVVCVCAVVVLNCVVSVCVVFDIGLLRPMFGCCVLFVCASDCVM